MYDTFNNAYNQYYNLISFQAFTNVKLNSSPQNTPVGRGHHFRLPYPQKQLQDLKYHSDYHYLEKGLLTIIYSKEE